MLASSDRRLELEDRAYWPELKRGAAAKRLSTTTEFTGHTASGG